MSSQPFKDLSGVGIALTGDAIALRDSGVVKYGSASMMFSGAAGGYFITAERLATTGDFVVEGWVKCLPYGFTHTFVNTTNLMVLYYTTGTTFRVTIGGTSYDWNAGSTFSSGAWVHLAFARSGTTIRVYVNGTQVLTATYAGQVGSEGGYTVFGFNSSTYYMYGYLDNWRITRQSRGYTGTTITVPSAAYPTGGSDPYWSDTVLLFDGTIATVGAKSALPLVSRKQAFSPASPAPIALPRLRNLRNVYHGGQGRISGTVKVKGSPNFPKFAPVYLMRDRDKVVVAEMWSDPATGAYSFDGWDHTERYTVIAYDPARSFRSVIADNLTPEVYL